LFFDLDHTLWDYDTNATAALKDLYKRHDIFQKSGFTSSQFITAFFKVNNALWLDFDLGLIGKEDIRRLRFPRIYQTLEASIEEIPLNIEVEYVELCPTKTVTMPKALEVLGYLKGKYKMHLITNGFKEIQTKKLESSMLAPFFSEIITSETAGYRKPDPRIFELALNKATAIKSESLMIGDNLIADIGGARNAGIDQVFFNPNRQLHQAKVTYEIQTLDQLTELL